MITEGFQDEISDLQDFKNNVGISQAAEKSIFLSI